MSLVSGLMSCQSRSRVKVERDIKLLDGRPEIPILRHVVKRDRIHIAILRKPIHQRATKSQFLDAAGQFLSSSLRVLEGQCGEAFQTFGGFGDVFSQMVICAACNVDCRRPDLNRLFLVFAP